MTNATALGWDTLFFNGSIIDLDIKVWSARLSVRPSDLGIEDTNEVREALGLGIVRLAPKKAFDRILTIRRAALKDVENHSFNFPFIRGARYVPEKKIEPLLEKLRIRRAEFTAEVDGFSDRYNFIRAEMLPVIRKALTDAACDNLDESLSRIDAEYPEDVKSRFFFGWTSYAISGAKSKAAQDAVTQETEQVKGVVREIVAQLRTEFTDKVSSVTKIIARGGKIPTNSLASCREVLARVKEMNVFGDTELTNQVRAFERVLSISEVEARPDNEALKMDLDAIAANVQESLDEAVAKAEATLTGLGNRKISMPERRK